MSSVRAAFDSRLQLEFHGAKVFSEARLFAARDLDRVLSLTESAAAML